MTKNQELANPNSCLNKAAGTEPVFVLRAQDITAPLFVRLWADKNAAVLGGSHPKILEAYAIAERMEAWPTRRTAT